MLSPPVSLSVIVCPHTQEVSDDITRVLSDTIQFLTALPWQREEKVSLTRPVFSCACVCERYLTGSSLAFIQLCLTVITRGQRASCCKPRWCSSGIVSRNPQELMGKGFPNGSVIIHRKKEGSCIVQKHTLHGLTFFAFDGSPSFFCVV